MISYNIKEPAYIDKALNWADTNISKGLKVGPVVMTLGREIRNNDQNAKLYAMCADFEPIEFNGKKWARGEWKCFLLSAFNKEMPAVGLLGEPVSMTLSSSKLTKKRFAEFIEFIYAMGAERGVRWSEPALKVYDEYREVNND